MKKSWLASCVLLLSLGSTLHAQKSNEDDPRTKFSFGVKAGLNVSNVWASDGQGFESDPKAGFAGGAFIGIPLGLNFGLQPEILVSQKGFQASGMLLGSEYSFKRTTTFIDVPLQIQVKPTSFLTIVGGPQFSYLVHQKSVYQLGSTSAVQEEAFAADDIRKNILGFVAGADLNISHLVISGRMSWDFMNNHGDGTSDTPQYKNRLVQLTVGYKL
jgi:hypothetical protein